MAKKKKTQPEKQANPQTTLVQNLELTEEVKKVVEVRFLFSIVQVSLCCWCHVSASSVYVIHTDPDVPTMISSVPCALLIVSGRFWQIHEAPNRKSFGRNNSTFVEAIVSKL